MSEKYFTPQLDRHMIWTDPNLNYWVLLTLSQTVLSVQLKMKKQSNLRLLRAVKSHSYH